MVVLDGANLSWTFSASLYAKLGCKTKLPLSRGVTLALESSDLWDALGVNPVAFMPESYVEGPLHGLADGGTLETLIPRNVEYLGDGRWRNVVLHDLAQRGIPTTRSTTGTEKRGRPRDHRLRTPAQRHDMQQ